MVDEHWPLDVFYRTWYYKSLPLRRSRFSGKGSAQSRKAAAAADPMVPAQAAGGAEHPQPAQDQRVMSFSSHLKQPERCLKGWEMFYRKKGAGSDMIVGKGSPRLWTYIYIYIYIYVFKGWRFEGSSTPAGTHRPHSSRETCPIRAARARIQKNAYAIKRDLF